MDKTRKGGQVPESDTKKASRPVQGATVIKGGQVPSEVLAKSTPSSPPEVLRSQEPQQDLTLVQADRASSAPSQTQAASPPSPDSAPKKRRKKEDDRNYQTWDLLGLEMDTEDPLLQREIRKHPTTGEVVLVPVGKAKEAGESPTPAPDSLRQEAGFGRDSAKPE